MAIGSVLVQPQKLQRVASADSDAVLMNDLVSLMAGVVTDPKGGGKILEAISKGVEATFQNVQWHVTTGLSKGQQKLRAWLQPMIDSVKSFSANPSAADTLAPGLELGQQLLLKLSDLAKGLTLDQLRGHLSLFLDVLQNDLGLTNTFLEDQLWALIDNIVLSLEKVEPGTENGEYEKRLGAASILRRVKRRMRGEFALPRLNAEMMARRLLDIVRNSGLESFAQKAACITTGLGGVVEAGTALTRLVPPGFTPPPHSLGAMGSNDSLTKGAKDNPPGNLQYCWYASWLLGGKDKKDKEGGGFGQFAENTGVTILRALPLPWMPDAYDAIWIDKNTKKVMRGDLFGGGGEELKNPKTLQPYPGSFSDWTELPMFANSSPSLDPYYTFKHAGKETIEKWAYHTAWAADALRVVLNLTSLEEGDYLSNSFNATYHLGQGLFKFIGKTPFNWWLPVVAGSNHHILWWILSRTPAPTLGGSFEGIHTKAAFGPGFNFWLWQAGMDGMEQYLLNTVVDTLRNAVLSFVTLLNFDGPVRHEPFPDDRPDDRAENRKEIDGVADLVALLLGLALPGPERTDYGYPFQSAKVFFLWNVLITTCYALLQAITGTVVAEIVAWAEDWGVLGKKMLSSILPAMVAFYPSLYLSAEGDTDDGKYNPSGTAFPGYPPASGSPYSLPYAEGASYECVQGNQGMWSHNNMTNPIQVYAYDFALDQGDEVLASRPGTVVSFFEGTENDTEAGGNWNNIVIRHDLQEDDAGNLTPLAAPLSVHDVGSGGAATVTFAVYGHGRKKGVTDAFALWKTPAFPTGVPTASIMGMQVKRGQPIMLADHTGTSAFNHVHMHVTDETSPRPAGTPAAPLSGATSGSVGVPFVFKEVKGKLEINRFTKGTDGVPSSLNYYTSSNKRIEG